MSVAATLPPGVPFVPLWARPQVQPAGDGVTNYVFDTPRQRWRWGPNGFIHYILFDGKGSSTMIEASA